MPKLEQKKGLKQLIKLLLLVIELSMIAGFFCVLVSLFLIWHYHGIEEINYSNYCFNVVVTYLCA